MEAVGERFDALFLGIGGQKLLAGLFVFLAVDLGLGVALGAHVVGKGHHHLASFLFGQEGFLAGNRVAQAGGQQIDVNLVGADALALEEIADVHAIAISTGKTAPPLLRWYRNGMKIVPSRTAWVVAAPDASGSAVKS